MPPFEVWIQFFAWTCILETPLYFWILRPHVEGTRRLLLLSFMLQVATHPALWYVFPTFEPRWLYILIGESCVTVVEASLVVLALKKESPTAIAFTAAIAANIFSTAMGLWVLPALGLLPA